MEYKFDRPRSDKIPRKKIMEELERVAKLCNYTDYSIREFDNLANNISSSTVRTEFGSWLKAKEALRNFLKLKGLDLKPKGPQQTYSEKQLFTEMERIWRMLGYRPSVREWETSAAKISSGTYKNRFGSWKKACLKFIEYKMGGYIALNNENNPYKNKREEEHTSSFKNKEDGRTIPVGVRFKVLDRDNYCCVFCGRSPATDVGVRLHIDHIVPFSKGGKTIIDNLQTLCKECNIGKSDKEGIGNIKPSRSQH